MVSSSGFVLCVDEAGRGWIVPFMISGGKGLRDETVEGLVLDFLLECDLLCLVGCGSSEFQPDASDADDEDPELEDADEGAEDDEPEEDVDSDLLRFIECWGMGEGTGTDCLGLLWAVFQRGSIAFWLSDSLSDELLDSILMSVTVSSSLSSVLMSCASVLLSACLRCNCCSLSYRQNRRNQCCTSS